MFAKKKSSIENDALKDNGETNMKNVTITVQRIFPKQKKIFKLDRDA